VKAGRNRRKVQIGDNLPACRRIVSRVACPSRRNRESQVQGTHRIIVATGPIKEHENASHATFLTPKTWAGRVARRCDHTAPLSPRAGAPVPVGYDAPGANLPKTYLPTVLSAFPGDFIPPTFLIGLPYWLELALFRGGCRDLPTAKHFHRGCEPTAWSRLKSRMYIFHGREGV